jgi:hypothetical protein
MKQVQGDLWAVLRHWKETAWQRQVPMAKFHSSFVEAWASDQ